MISPGFSTPSPDRTVKQGYRFSMEPFLLAFFMSPESGDRVLDVGTGSGIIPHLLYRKHPFLYLDAIEIQSTLFQLATQNLEADFDRIQLVEDDFLKWAQKVPANSYDWIVSNPPYRKRNSGRVNPDPEKALARHEIALDLETLVTASASLLKPKGHIILSYPDNRLDEVQSRLVEAGLKPRKIWRIRGFSKTAPRFFLIESVKSREATPIQEQMFTIYEETREYTSAMQAVYRSFGYPIQSHRALPSPSPEVA